MGYFNLGRHLNKFCGAIAAATIKRILDDKFHKSAIWGSYFPTDVYFFKCLYLLPL